LTGGGLLLVDDDEVFRERLGRALRARGYEVATAGDHEAALALGRKQRFDFAVVDLRMPSGSGLALIEPLRALAPGARIVVLTGYGSIASAVEALRLGAHDYLAKPVDADDIIGALGGEGARPRTATGTATGTATDTPGAPAPTPTLARAEWEHIQRVLADCGNNISEAARRLGITRRTLQLKLKKYPPRV
jgi:two-component system response regulator RegA